LNAIAGIIWIYVLGSIALLYCVRRTRSHLLYALKSIWVAFTVLAFGWVVLMSGATNQEFALRPAGVFETIGGYPESFRKCFGISGWLPAILLWVPLWAGSAMTEERSALRLQLRLALGALSIILAIPLIRLCFSYDWSPYTHFKENYVHAWQVARMGDYFLNSVLVSLCTVGLVMLLASMAAYAFARLQFRGREALMTLFVAAMAVPGFLLVVPLFVMMKDWTIGNFSFMDSRAGLAVLYAAVSLPFTIFVLTAFYRTLPAELAESAAIDGASPWQIFADVYFPLAAPGLATAAIFNFLGVWNEYNFALIFVTNPDFKTLPVGLYNLQVSQQYAVNWPAMFAGIVILCAPTFLIFVILQERIVAGITAGAVKG
jgi:ABC-type glycerol-3-phosphate transport system permease component